MLQVALKMTAVMGRLLVVGIESADSSSDGGGRGRVEMVDGQRDDEEGRCESHGGLYIWLACITAQCN